MDLGRPVLLDTGRGAVKLRSVASADGSLTMIKQEPQGKIPCPLRGHRALICGRPGYGAPLLTMVDPCCGKGIQHGHSCGESCPRHLARVFAPESNKNFRYRSGHGKDAGQPGIIGILRKSLHQPRPELVIRQRNSTACTSSTRASTPSPLAQLPPAAPGWY